MVVTSQETWESCGASLMIGSGAAGWVADDRSALTLADEMLPSGQALVLTPAPGDHGSGIVSRRSIRDVRFARRGPEGRHTSLLHRPLTAQALNMVPHPEGGWFTETWRASATFTPPGYPGERSAATAILFLLPPDEASRWHVVSSDELWFWHSGGPLALTLGGTGDRPQDQRTVILGPDLTEGQIPQALVPGQTWQSARPQSGETLVSCVVSPGFDFADFRILPH
ncbi:MAG TPA: cupin domain-containing protein [Streptosporangiaceae bacterium]|nr:cupin domain-containing protein [Streptosporangiaceae bacterium]